MKKHIFKIIIEIDEQQAIKDPELVRAVKDEVEAFTQEINKFGVKGGYEQSEEVTKTL